MGRVLTPRMQLSLVVASQIGACSSADRASACGAEGRAFESLQAHQKRKCYGQSIGPRTTPPTQLQPISNQHDHW